MVRSSLLLFSSFLHFWRRSFNSGRRRRRAPCSNKKKKKKSLDFIEDLDAQGCRRRIRED